MKGQLEINFQWIYVLIAGGAFLIIFFLAFRSFSDNEEQRSNALGVRAAATMLSNALWQPESAKNMSMNAEVSCTGGVLTLTHNGDSDQIDRTPVFLPPLLSGRAAVHTKPVMLAGERTPPIGYGNVLYVLDQNTYYYYIDEHVEGLTTRRFETPFAEPEGARSIVIIGENENFDFPVPQTRARIYGVNVQQERIQFYEYRNGWQLDQEQQYTGDEMAFGAMISANATNFACGQNNFLGRAQNIKNVYADRSRLLLSRMRPECVSDHQRAISLFDQNKLFDQQLLTSQQSLYLMDCPVIA